MAKSVSDVAILGAGSWGSALALHLTRVGARVRLWEFDPQRAREVARTRFSRPFLPDHELPASIAVTSDLATALRDAAVGVAVVPTHVLRGVCEQVAVCSPPPNCLWVSAVKGIEEGSGFTPSELLTTVTGIPPQRVVVLAGPSFAVEVAAGKPTAVLAASTDLDAAERVQALFSGANLRVYTSQDIRGVELGVALKNVMAIAAGIAEGLGLGRNALGALLTRGLAEMARLGVRLGGRFETFLGLAGLGDLVTTGTSELSRNFRVGLALAKGRPIEQILDEMVMVAEGVRTARSTLELARAHRVEMPITEQVCAVIYEGKSPRAAVEDLMQRPLRSEFWGGAP